MDNQQQVVGMSGPTEIRARFPCPRMLGGGGKDVRR